MELPGSFLVTEAQNLGVNLSLNDFKPPHIWIQRPRESCIHAYSYLVGFTHPPLAGIAQSVLWAWNIPLYGN